MGLDMNVETVPNVIIGSYFLASSEKMWHFGRFWGFGVWGLGFGVWGLGFGVWGLGFEFFMALGPETGNPTPRTLNP